MTPFIQETDLARSRPFKVVTGCVMATTALHCVAGQERDGTRFERQFNQIACYDLRNGFYMLGFEPNATRVA